MISPPRYKPRIFSLSLSGICPRALFSPGREIWVCEVLAYVPGPWWWGWFPHAANLPSMLKWGFILLQSDFALHISHLCTTCITQVASHIFSAFCLLLFQLLWEDISQGYEVVPSCNISVKIQSSFKSFTKQQRLSMAVITNDVSVV